MFVLRANKTECELGNLQSEGHGISGFETMLSIGLGQEQQFTLILQTLQQLRDVYGDSVDKIVQGNTSNIVFLKSTDDSMLDTLQKMSGTTHRTRPTSKAVMVDNAKLFMNIDPNVNITYQTSEEPVITYNDMAFITERNSMVFRAGDSPVWNRNETILPMSWRLFQNTITHPGHEYTLQTIPTLSSALEFDVRKNQPNFQNMLDKRMEQASMAVPATEAYQKAYGYTDYDMERLDPDVKADDIMQVINAFVARKKNAETADEAFDDELYTAEFLSQLEEDGNVPEENTEVLEAAAQAQAEMNVRSVLLYAGRKLSKNDLVGMSGAVNHALDKDIIRAYCEVMGDFEQDRTRFVVRSKSLYGADGTAFIEKQNDTAGLKELDKASKDPNLRVFVEDGQEIRSVASDDMNGMGSFVVHDAFYHFLVSQDSWTFAKGRFEQEMSRLVDE